VSLKHRKVIATADAVDSNKLRPSDWGSTSTDYGTTPTHVFDGGALGSLAMRDTGSVDGLSWLAAAPGVLACAGAGQAPAFTVSPTLTNATTAVTLGSSLVSNGDFAANLTGWTGTNWAWSGSAPALGAKHTTGSTAALTQAGAVVVAGTHYRLTFAINGRNAGTVTPSVGGAIFAATSSATNTLNFYATATTALAFTPSTDFDGAIDDVVLVVMTNGTATIGGRMTVIGKTMIGTDQPTIADDYVLLLSTSSPGAADVLRLVAPAQASLAFSPFQTANSAHILGYAVPGANTGIGFITHDITRMTINPEGPIGINYSPVTDVFAVGGKTGVITQRITGFGGANGTNLGLGIDCGVGSSDWGLRIRNQDGSAELLKVRGDGAVVMFQQKAATGSRYLVIDTNGVITSSASAPVGT
jgi:hypothetical protein